MADETGSTPAGNPEPTATPAAPAAEPVPAATPEPIAAPAPAVASEPWIDSVQDTDTRTWAESKGLQNGSFENVLGSYHNLEKLMGADRAGRTVTLLGDDPTPEQTNEFYNRLGRPEVSDGYTFKLDDGADTARLDSMRGKAHELGITDAQFTGLAEADGEYLASLSQANVDANTMAATDAEASLRTEWGAAYDQNFARVDQYAEQLGISEDQLQGLRSSMGPVEAMKFVHGLGTKLGDDTMDTGEPVGGALTPAQAQTQLGELNMNKEFMEAWLTKSHAGHKAAVEKKSALARQAAGQAA